MSKKRLARPKKHAAAQIPAARLDAPLRIIGGKYGGRKLAYSGDERTRPMKQRVREAIFNLIGPAVQGKHALDLFAGTGALGLEALSRGAIGATFVERHYPTAGGIRETIAALGISEPCEVVAADSFIWTRKQLAGCVSLSAPWVVFCSPPYDFFVDRTEDMLAQINHVLDSAPRDSRIVVESDQRFDTALLPDYLEWDVRTYSPAVVAIAKTP